MKIKKTFLRIELLNFTVLYLTNMVPEEAMSNVSQILERPLADLDCETCERFLMNPIEQSGGNKAFGIVFFIEKKIDKSFDNTED